MSVPAASMAPGGEEICVLPDSWANYTTPADEIVVSGGISILERQA